MVASRILYLLVAVTGTVTVVVMIGANLYRGSPPPAALGQEQTLQSNTPMALSLGYWEQLGNGLKSLYDLQCWASTVGISSVVEPSVKPRSDTLAFMAERKCNKSVTLGDLFDLEHWNQMSRGHGFSPLVTQEAFLKHAARDVVYVQLRYAHNMRCRNFTAIRNTSWYVFLEREGFHMQRTVCVNFSKEKKLNPGKLMSEESFWEKIKAAGPTMTVLFDSWRGIRQRGDRARVLLEGPKTQACLKKSKNLVMSDTLPDRISYVGGSSPLIFPSQPVADWVETFVRERLPKDGYVAIMLRTEKLSGSILNGLPEASQCSDNILSDWRNVTRRMNLSGTLFFSDAGSHGSSTWSSPHARRFSQYIQKVLQVSPTLSEVNSILEDMTGSRNSVLIAFLQQQLVVRATCVVVVGGGTFQAQALNMYAHKHRGRECYVSRNADCTPQYIQVVYGV